MIKKFCLLWGTSFLSLFFIAAIENFSANYIVVGIMFLFMCWLYIFDTFTIWDYCRLTGMRFLYKHLGWF